MSRRSAETEVESSLIRKAPWMSLGELAVVASGMLAVGLAAVGASTCSRHRSRQGDQPASHG